MELIGVSFLIKSQLAEDDKEDSPEKLARKSSLIGIF